METLGIEYLAYEDGKLKARMPVDARTRQPAGFLHGGASIALAETMGSLASNLLLNPIGAFGLGLEVNGNHFRPVRSGYVYGTCVALHIGRTTHVWEIRITDEADRLVNISRLTVAVRFPEQQTEKENRS